MYSYIFLLSATVSQSTTRRNTAAAATASAAATAAAAVPGRIPGAAAATTAAAAAAEFPHGPLYRYQRSGTLRRSIDSRRTAASRPTVLWSRALGLSGWTAPAGATPSCRATATPTTAHSLFGGGRSRCRAGHRE